MEQQGMGLADYVAILRRRWLLLVAPAVLGLIAAAIVAASLPERYRASARILVESQTIPEDLARATVTSGAVERLRVIEQRLMTRPILLDIAQRFAVFGDRQMSPNAIVFAMREATQFQNVALATIGRNQVTASAIDIVFEAGQAGVTARVANEFVTLLLQENLRTRGESAQETLTFFTGEMDRLGTELRAVEEQIKAFKIANEGALPDSLQFRRSELLAMQARALERERRRAVLAADRRSIQAAIEAGIATGVALSPQEQELQRLRQNLDQSQALYAPSHPTIRTLQGRITALENAIAASAGAPGGNDAGTEPPAAVGAMAELERRLDAIDREIAVLDEQDTREQGRAAAIEASILRTPEVEIALTTLVRRQQNLQVQYQDAVLKRSQAETGERLEVTRASERFEIIEQAQTPQSPIWPNRPLIAAAGFAGGGAIGFALMVLIELLNQRIRTPGDLERRFDLRPIVTIPYIFTERELRRRRLAFRTAGLVVLVLAPVVLYAVDRYVTPLQRLADAIGRQFGVSVIGG